MCRVKKKKKKSKEHKLNKMGLNDHGFWRKKKTRNMTRIKVIQKSNTYLQGNIITISQVPHFLSVQNIYTTR